MDSWSFPPPQGSSVPRTVPFAPRLVVNTVRAAVASAVGRPRRHAPVFLSRRRARSREGGCRSCSARTNTRRCPCICWRRTGASSVPKVRAFVDFAVPRLKRYFARLSSEASRNAAAIRSRTRKSVCRIAGIRSRHRTSLVDFRRSSKPAASSRSRRPIMGAEQKVVIITGASQGIGAASSRPIAIAIFASSPIRARSRRRRIRIFWPSPATSPIRKTARADRLAGDRALRPHRHAGQQCRHLHRKAVHRLYRRRLSRRSLRINLGGFFHITQRVAAEMLKRGSGHIVQITTSLVDHANSNVPSVLASLTKGGLNAATKSLAIEYAKKGIRVNAVAPGVIKTPMHAPETHEFLANLHPVGRMGEMPGHRRRRAVPGERGLRDRRNPARRWRPERRPLIAARAKDRAAIAVSDGCDLN